ncbi:t-snare family protein [Nannochloropsis oceanica]
MDRTREFQGLLKLFGMTDLPVEDEPDDFHHNGSSSTDPSSSTSSFPPHGTSDFGAAAATVAKEFTSIRRLVHRLQRLVTRKGMHNDPTAEIEDVTAVFKKDLGRLQGDIESLLRFAEKHYRQGQQRHRHCTCVVEGLKIRATEHTKLFQAALQVRQGVLKDQADRRKLFTHSARGPALAYDSPLFVGPAPPPRVHPPPPPPPQRSSPPPVPFDVGVEEGNRNGQYQQQQHPRPEQYQRSWQQQQQQQLGQQQRGRGRGGDGPDAGLRRRYAPPPSYSSSGRGMMMPPHHQYHHQQQQQQQQVQRKPQRDTASRLKDARAIEKAIVELGQTFSKMAGLVAAQGEVVMRIDDDMEMALEDVRKGHTEMENYLRIVRGNRAVIIKVFVVLIVFILLFVRYF